MPSTTIADDTIAVHLPRSALTIVERPRTVTQRSAERVLGIGRRAYLDLAREYAAAGGEVIALGQLRVIELDPLLAWLRTRSRPAAARADASEGDELAAELGLEPVARVRGRR